jgi:hypothetical protein
MIKRRTPSILAGLLLLLGVGYLAHATMGTSDTRVFPYTGTLRIGSTAASGVYDFRFGLFSAEPTGSTADCLLGGSPSCSLWSEETTGVDVSAGRFSVSLGEAQSLPDSVLAQDALWLAIAVKGPDDAGFSLLAGAQEILPTPWAARAAAAKDYKVTGTLSVGNGASVTGDVDVSGGLWAEGAYVGLMGHGASWSGIAHEDRAFASNYALMQHSDGRTFLNASTGQYVSTRINNAEQLRVDAAATYIWRGLRLSCPSCGATDTLDGSEAYGTLTLQGPVLSADADLHLSPPGGSDVVINDTYRAAGGNGIGAAGLVVEGRISSGSYVSQATGSHADYGTDLEANSADKGFFAAGGCPIGVVRVSTCSTQACICGCIDADNGRGWYCFH